MSTLITVLVLIVSILLGVIVLIQNPKGGGLGAGMGNANQIGGVKRTADFLEKATWSLIIGLVVLCLASTWTMTSGSGVDQIDDFQGEAERYEAPAPTQAPTDAVPAE